MFNSRVGFKRWFLSLVAVSAGLPAVQADETPAGVPRYRLQVGQELRYAGQSEFKYDNGAHHTESTFRIWVIRENEAGGWRLVMRSGSTLTQANAQRSSSADERVTFAWCDITPAGEVAENDTLGFRLRPNGVLPRLPNDVAASQAGWTSEYHRLDERKRYRLLPDQSQGSKMTIEAILDSAMNEIYGTSNVQVVTFDTSRGLPEKIVETNTQTYGFNGKGEGTTSLKAVEKHDAAWAREFAADADRYFAAKQAYDKVTGERNQSPDDLEKSLAKAIADLKTARERIKSSELQEQIDHDIKEHDGYVSY